MTKESGHPVCAPTELRYVVKGDPRTKKNSMMIAGNGARCPRCGKFEKEWIRQGKAYNDYAEQAAWQLRPKPEKPIIQPVNVRYLFYMKTHRRVDLVNLMEAMDDILVGKGILKDDNASVIAGHDGSRVLYDKENPRVEIEITEFRADAVIGPYENGAHCAPLRKGR